MNNKSIKNTSHPLLYGIKNFFSRLLQTPDSYSIKYYKKSKRLRRNWQEPNYLQNNLLTPEIKQTAPDIWGRLFSRNYCGKYAAKKGEKALLTRQGNIFYFVLNCTNMKKTTAQQFFSGLAKFVSETFENLFVSESSREFRRLKNFVAS